MILPPPAAHTLKCSFKGQHKDNFAFTYLFTFSFFESIGKTCSVVYNMRLVTESL